MAQKKTKKPRHKREPFSEHEWEPKGNKLLVEGVEIALKKQKSSWNTFSLVSGLSPQLLLLQPGMQQFPCSTPWGLGIGLSRPTRSQCCWNVRSTSWMVPTLHNVTGLFAPSNRGILHWTALCSVLFTNLRLWLVVLERHLWLFGGVARSQACALMLSISTFGFKAEGDWAAEGWRFRLQFQMDENEGGKSSIKTEPWEVQWYSAAEPIQ